MRRFSFYLVLAAFVLSCGGQWAVFQCLAWGNMIREYSQVVPITEAVHMTFSGDYPCALCRAIADKKSHDQQQKVLAEQAYLKKFFAAKITVPPRSAVSLQERHWIRQAALSFRKDAPPVPPPRCA